MREIFEMCTVKNMPDTRIAETLNARGLTNQHGRPWSAHNVKAVLTNEKYAGTLIFNRSTQRMRSSRRPNDADKWIRLEGAFPSIVTRELFEQTRCERARRGKHWTNDEMLDGLRDILVEHGRVSADLIDTSALPSTKSYAFRFRSLVAAFEAAGVSRSSLSRSTITRYRIRCVTKDLSAELEKAALHTNADVEKVTPRTYRIAGVTVRVLCTRCRYERSHPCWKVTLRHFPAVDFIIWARMDELNESVARIYLIPVHEFPEHQYLWPSTRTLRAYERFAHSSIRHLFGIT